MVHFLQFVLFQSWRALSKNATNGLKYHDDELVKAPKPYDKIK